MLNYCPIPAFNGYVALPLGCNVDSVVERFMEDYKLYDFRFCLWRLAKTAIMHDDFDSGEREELIDFLHELECVMEVVYLDWSQESPKQKSTLKD